MAWGVPKLGTLQAVASGDLTLTEPASVADGDLLVACIGYRSNATFTLPAGWSLVATQQSSGDTDATNGIASGVMAYQVRSGTPNLTFTRTAGDVAQGRIVAYTGGHASTPYDTGQANTQLASNTPQISGFTTAEAGELLVYCISLGDNLTATSIGGAFVTTNSGSVTDTTSAPAGETAFRRCNDGTATGADHTLAIADVIKSTAGSTGVMTALASAAAGHVMIVGAFKLAAAGPPPTAFPFPRRDLRVVPLL